eukprot:gene13437-19293_t
MKVMNPLSSEGPLIMVVECPTQAHLTAMTQSTAMADMTQVKSEGVAGGPPPTPRVRIMAHFTPSHVACSSEYQAWVASLGPGWRHLLLSSGSGQLTAQQRATALQAKLNCLHPTLFPPLKLDPASSWSGKGGAAQGPDVVPLMGVLPDGSFSAMEKEDLPNLAKAVPIGSEWDMDAGKLVRPPSGFRFHLAPFKILGPDIADIAKEDNIAELQESFKSSTAEIIAQAVQSAALSTAIPGEEIPEVIQKMGREEVEITFLGTCASMPSKLRNVTSIYVDFFSRGGMLFDSAQCDFNLSHGRMLFDCGEDAVGQLQHKFGREDAMRRVKELKAIVFTHMHADHHGALYGLLEMRARMGAPPLLIMGPTKLFYVLEAYNEALPLTYHFIFNNWFVEEDYRSPPPHVLESYEKTKAELGLNFLGAFKVDHIWNSFGVKIEGESGWKVCFSGDTRPTQKLVDASMDATLLIHEATFEDDMAAEAKAKKHSTTSDAMWAADQSRAYRVLLTHFSTRYPTMPLFDMDKHPNLCVAMDFMSINLKDLPWLPGMVRPLDALFKKEQASWEEDEVEAVPVGTAPAQAVVPAAAEDGKGDGPGAEKTQNSS